MIGAASYFSHFLWDVDVEFVGSDVLTAMIAGIAVMTEITQISEII